MSKFMTTLGLQTRDRWKRINYGERSPLVVPPTRDLPPPIAAARLPSPDWPKDPDISKRAGSQGQEEEPQQLDLRSRRPRPLRPERAE